MQAMAHAVERRFTSARFRLPTPCPRDPLALLEQFGSTVSVHRDREIYGQGDQAAYCYRVLSGCVRMVKLMEDGRRQVGEFLMAGDLIGFDVDRQLRFRRRGSHRCGAASLSAPDSRRAGRAQLHAGPTAARRRLDQPPHGACTPGSAGPQDRVRTHRQLPAGNGRSGCHKRSQAHWTCQ